MSEDVLDNVGRVVIKAEDNLENENEKDYETKLSNFLKDYFLVLEELGIIKGGNQ